MRRLVIGWAGVNTFSYNVEGLGELAGQIGREFGSLGAEAQQVELAPQRVIDSEGEEVQRPLGRAISLSKRPTAARRAFLGIHMDTVFPPESPFQAVEQIDAKTLRGPGVVDAKGGLAEMLVVLEAFERTALAEQLGWEVLINPDEEIGSPGSGPLFAQIAKRNHVGLIFEPARDDGGLVSHRRGSGNFTLVVRGRSAHAGRDPQLGRNAIHALAEFIVGMQSLASDEITVNAGKVEGGGPVNIVPGLAIARFNLRVADAGAQQRAERWMGGLVAAINQRDGIRGELHGSFHCPPKPLDDRTRQLLELTAECGRELGLNLTFQPSGGVTDGNKLAAGGLPTIDSLGPRGGGIHSHNEFLLVDTLAERAKLAFLLLCRIAEGAW